MWINIHYETDDATLLAMKNRAYQMALEAEAAMAAYKKILLWHWQQWVRARLGRLPTREHSVECEINDAHGTRVISAFAVEFGYGGDKPELLFHERVKSGKWGKQEYRHFLPCEISRISGCGKVTVNELLAWKDKYQ